MCSRASSRRRRRSPSSTPTSSYSKGLKGAQVERVTRLAGGWETWASLAVLLVFLAAWEWGPAALGVPSYIVPTASECYRELFRMVGRDNLFFHMGITAAEVITGF